MSGTSTPATTSRSRGRGRVVRWLCRRRRRSGPAIRCTGRDRHRPPATRSGLCPSPRRSRSRTPAPRRLLDAACGGRHIAAAQVLLIVAVVAADGVAVGGLGGRRPVGAQVLVGAVGEGRACTSGSGRSPRSRWCSCPWRGRRGSPWRNSPVLLSASRVRLVCPFTRHIQLLLKRHETVSVAAWTLTATWQFARSLTAAVLAGHPDLRCAAPEERHVVDHPHLGPDNCGQPLDDSLQGLHVPVRQAFGHRLDRVAPPVPHQAPLVARATSRCRRHVLLQVPIRLSRRNAVPAVGFNPGRAAAAVTAAPRGTAGDTGVADDGGCRAHQAYHP
ncbi:hypothetical protein SAMN04487980_103955 [Streptomyces sp. cf124]|nr:hypothetical protein SAMN04487980_103955 [Streptomyces sp. cf124]